MIRPIRLLVFLNLLCVMLPGVFAQHVQHVQNTLRSQTVADPPQQKQTISSHPASDVNNDRVLLRSILRELQHIRSGIAEQNRLLQLSHKMDVDLAAHQQDTSMKAAMRIDQKWSALGNPNAPVTIVEFTDYECPYCRTFHLQTFPQLRSQYIDTGKVRFITRNFPLAGHPYAHDAAATVYCAKDQSKFWEMHDLMIVKSGQVDNGGIASLAQALSLDVGALTECINKHKYDALIEADTNDAIHLGIPATPTFVVGTTASEFTGERIVGAASFETFKTYIDKLLPTSGFSSPQHNSQQSGGD